MNCKNIEHKIIEHCDSKAAQPLTEEVKAHLENCESCKRFFETSLMLEDFIQERKSVDSENFFLSKVMAKIEAAEETNPKIIKHKFLRSSRSVAASVLFIIALGLGVLVGKYSADIYTNSTELALEKTSDILGIQLADNGFDLINFEE